MVIFESTGHVLMSSREIPDRVTGKQGPRRSGNDENHAVSLPGFQPGIPVPVGQRRHLTVRFFTG